MGGQKLHAIGLRRISRDFVSCVIAIEVLEKLRVKSIYSQKIWSKLISLEAVLFQEHELSLLYRERLETVRLEKLPPKLQSGPRLEIPGD